MKDKFKTGAICIIIGNCGTHQFEIGDTVEIMTSQVLPESFVATNGKTKYWVRTKDLIHTGLYTTNQ